MVFVALYPLTLVAASRTPFSVAGKVCPPDWTPKLRDTGTWKAMEDLYEQGKVKALGGSGGCLGFRV